MLPHPAKGQLDIQVGRQLIDLRISHSAPCRSVDDSFVVVITMLLGELDYELMTKSGDNVMLVKLIILLFIMMMSIVLINLIIGLAINDIATLRYTLK